SRRRRRTRRPTRNPRGGRTPRWPRAAAGRCPCRPRHWRPKRFLNRQSQEFSPLQTLLCYQSVYGNLEKSIQNRVVTVNGERGQKLKKMQDSSTGDFAGPAKNLGTDFALFFD